MAKVSNYVFIPDPIKLGRVLWPDMRLYRKQIDIVYSVEHNFETHVVAGNQLGKDYVSAFIALVNFLKPVTCRVITTSVKDDHLRVLWGEIGRFIETSKYPLTVDKGGPLQVNHRDIKKVLPGSGGKVCSISYLRGMVSEKGEGLAGHHAEHTLLIGDEASGLDEQVDIQSGGWAKRKLYIGNPNSCQNFFFRAIEAGDLLADESDESELQIR